tara:strand:+ start:565 stop:1827 length:1263 start_codon:yes stop_codon:yes gene_type:complete
MKKFLIVFLSLTAILSAPVNAQISQRYTYLCPFLEDGFSREGDYFVYQNLDKDTTQKTAINEFTYHIPIPESLVNTISDNIYRTLPDLPNTVDGEEYIPGVRIAGVRKYNFTFDPVQTEAFRVHVSDCDISNSNELLLERTLRAFICSPGGENENFNEKYIREMVNISREDPTGNPKGFYADFDIHQEKDTINLLSDALVDVIDRGIGIANPDGTYSKRFCESETYTDFDGNEISTYCDDNLLVNIDNDAIASNVDEYADLNTACSVKVPFKLKIGESIFLNNINPADPDSDDPGLTIGYATVRCEDTPSGPELTTIPNTGTGCDPDSIDLYENRTLDTACDRQLCIFTGRAACPPRTIYWGSGENKCRVTLPFATNETKFENIENENPTKEGYVDVFCLASGSTEPSWEIVAEHSCVDK